MRARLGLAVEQVDALWLLACVEVDPLLSRLAAAFGTSECADVSLQTLQLLLASGGSDELDDEQIEALISLGLVETTTEARLPIHRRWIRASDRVVELARGRVRLDRALSTIARIDAGDQLAARTTTISPELVCAFDQARTLIVATGCRGSGRATLLARLAARSAKGTLRVRAADLARDVAGLTRQIRAIRRECGLFDVVPLLEGLDAIEHFAIVEAELLRTINGPVLATAGETRVWATARSVVSHHVTLPSEREREAIWQRVLDGAPRSVMTEIAGRYAIAPGAIVAAAETARARAGSAGAITAAHVRDGVRTHVDRQLAAIATRIESTQTWNDLVLPPWEIGQIVELVARVRNRRQVLDEWGFADKVGRGLGVAALMSGPPGTGKTMVAGLVAKELDLDLYQVDLSRVVSKYIGETEKNLAAVFDAAESGHAILLFDEADAMFAKRSEVKSSNDRYANLETNYLLQRLEAFSGIAILTTNHETAIDEAFRRRLAMHLRFPDPDEAHRELLWRALLPARASVASDIDFGALARELPMTGGYIKNAMLRAAYLAADEGTAISMSHLWRAARGEYEATGTLVHHRQVA
jgi:hypothetical protein